MHQNHLQPRQPLTSCFARARKTKPSAPNRPNRRHESNADVAHGCTAALHGALQHTLQIWLVSAILTGTASWPEAAQEPPQQQPWCFLTSKALLLPAPGEVKSYKVFQVPNGSKSLAGEKLMEGGVKYCSGTRR